MKLKYLLARVWLSTPGRLSLVATGPSNLKKNILKRYFFIHLTINSQLTVCFDLFQLKDIELEIKNLKIFVLKSILYFSNIKFYRIYIVKMKCL